MMKKILLLLGASLALAACGGPKKSESVTAPGANQQGGTGPYAVEFDGTTKTYQHSFKMPINQREGKVEYYITTPQEADIQLLDTQVKVTGCAAGQVSHQILWMPDIKKSEGVYVIVGSIFRTLPGVQGSVAHILRGLTGCTEIEMSTTLMKLN